MSRAHGAGNTRAVRNHVVMADLKLTNRTREDGGKWLNATETTLTYARKLLREYRESEPLSDWHLETRGTVADWHRINEDDVLHETTTQGDPS